ncbi:MAG: 16S rRNA methyltransferase [Candidatus Bathyarchaeia archaeon]
MVLFLVIAESSLETVPEELWSDRNIRAHAARLGKEPGDLLLDRSYHHRAMLRLAESHKRGRPDIIHASLLQALGSPLNKEGLLRMYVHTVRDYVIQVEPTVRIPKNYNRFVGLMEQLLKSGRVPLKGSPLLTMNRKSMSQLLQEIRPSFVLALTREGEKAELAKVISLAKGQTRFCVVVGGFPRGHFSLETRRLADSLICIDKESLETYVVVSRVIYAYEQVVGLPSKRL